MKRSGFLRRTSRVNRVSANRQATRAEYAAFKRWLFADYGHVCAFCRDPKCLPLDPHHTRKPRSRYLTDPESVIPLGRPHHDRAEFPYTNGRLVCFGSRSVGWIIGIMRGADKHTAIIEQAVRIEPHLAPRMA